ncbi:LysR family transcriptional regulator [Erwinia mallotivora]|uniref:LysR family transcriptional regulator n=1 Tax=Erwinia mallotivora TaxID=69222 RepID=UPI0021BE90E2|nr:LysR family transcriptional regulator [Erwinia mallotivora]
MNIDTGVLRSLVLIHETGTFLAAATELNRTQSALSQQMALFEEQLGKPLFIRKGRNKVLNDEGLRVFKIAEAIIKLTDEIKNPDAYVEHSALQQQVNVLAAENVKIKLCNDVLSEELRGYESEGAYPDPVAPKLWYSAEHLETDRLLAKRDREIEARGAIAVRNALILAPNGADVYAVASKVAAQLRAGEQGGDHA